MRRTAPIDPDPIVIDDVDGGIRIARGRDGRYYVKTWTYDDRYEHTGLVKSVKRVEMNTPLSPAAVEGIDGFANALARLVPPDRQGPTPCEEKPAVHPGWGRPVALAGSRWANLLETALIAGTITELSLAAIAGVAPITVDRWIQGESVPVAPEVINAVADALGIDREKLADICLDDHKQRQGKGRR